MTDKYKTFIKLKYGSEIAMFNGWMYRDVELTDIEIKYLAEHMEQSVDELMESYNNNKRAEYGVYG